LGLLERLGYSAASGPAGAEAGRGGGFQVAAVLARTTEEEADIDLYCLTKRTGSAALKRPRFSAQRWPIGW